MEVTIVWIIGFLFVWGLATEDLKKENKYSYFLYIICFLFQWPFLLGCYVDEHIKAKSPTPEAETRPAKEDPGHKD
jgi:hypothetical protein